MSNIELLAFVWLGLLGSCFGSFMNVVIYRLPAGKSLSHPGSHCPHCQKPIRPYHNLPVIGWLLLRGKCYDCGATIAARYPLVEGLVAITFLILAGVIFRPGTTHSSQSIADVRLWGIYINSAVFSCTLICIIAIKYDEQHIPRSLYTLAAAAVMGFIICAWLAMQ